MHENDKKLSVQFFMHPRENAKKSKEAGRPIFEDVEMVSIVSPGNKNAEHTAGAHSLHFDSNVDKQWTYAERFAEHYEAFKRGGAEQAVGTPLAEVPFLTMAQKAEMAAMKITTVEQLAGMADRTIRSKGMGFRQYVDAAKAYLDTSNGTNKLVDEIAELRAQLAAMQAKPEKVEASTEPDEFTGMEDEDLRNVLTDAGVTPDGRWGRAKLVSEIQKLAQAKESEAA